MRATRLLRPFSILRRRGARLAATGLVALVAAFTLHAQSSPPMQHFVLLFRKGPQPLGEGAQQRRQAAIREWAQAQYAAGRILEPRNLGGESAQPGLVAPPSAVGEWPVVALVFLEAHDFAEATAVAAAHPAKDFDTSVEVRPWSPPAASLVAVRAAGAFDVEMKPQEAAGSPAGRFRLAKQYHGDLEAMGTGEMLTGMTAEKGSAGYVAIEQVSGTLAGRKGTFLLQHSGQMSRGAQSLSITVVPGSGTGELAGLSGTMAVQVSADGAHAYTFDYVLPAPAGAR